MVRPMVFQVNFPEMHPFKGTGMQGDTKQFFLLCLLVCGGCLNSNFLCLEDFRGFDVPAGISRVYHNLGLLYNSRVIID